MPLLKTPMPTKTPKEQIPAEKRIRFKRLPASRRENLLALRFFAFVVDTWIVKALMVLITDDGPLFFNWLSVQTKPGDANRAFLFSTGTDTSGSLPFFVMAYLLYSSLLECSTLQGSLGKWFFRFKVCDGSENKISFARALARNFLKGFSALTIIGVVMINLTPRRQGLHDLLARTIVIRR